MHRSLFARRTLVTGAASLLAAPYVTRARAEPVNAVKIGIMNDASGPFADQSGRGSLVAAQLAVADFNAKVPGLAVELVYGDHQNKPDVGSTLARQWVDRDGVAAIADMPNSAVGLAVNDIMRQRNRTFVASNVATSDLTGKYCAPTTVQWTLDTWAMGNAAARARKAQGQDSWFFIQVDYALGAAIVRDTTQALEKIGGKVLGVAKHPLGTTDFASILVQAQSSGAKVLALANTGADLVNALKQANEFGLGQTMAIVAEFVQVTDVDSVGLEQTQGLFATEAFYWDLNERTRAFAKRFAAQMPGRVPTENHAGVYSSVLAYLGAVHQCGSVDGDKVIAALRGTEIDDPLFGPVRVRSDGRAIHEVHVLRVKSPAQSKGRWDYYELVQTIPRDDAFRPQSEGGCTLS